MATKIKGLSPRLLIRQKDNKTGSFPSIPRNSYDSRTGKYRISYTDEKTLFFTSGARGDDFSKGGDPIFDLRSPFGSYVSTGSLIRYWKFEQEDIIDIGNGTLFMRDRSPITSGATVISSSGPEFDEDVTVFYRIKNTPNFSGSRGAIQSNRADRALTTGDTSEPAFGNGTTDTPFSIVAWINLYNLNTQTTPRVIVCKSGTIAGREFAFSIESNNLNMRLWDESSSGAISVRTSITNLVVPNKWYHVAATYNATGTASNIFLYLNGQRLTSTPTTIGTYTAMENTGQSLYVAGSDNQEESLLGAIDEVGIFNRALNRNEIAQIAGYKKGISMPSGLPVESPFLVKNIQTSLFVSGTVRKGVSDQYISFTPGQELTPFCDSDRLEQSTTATFALTGSPPEEIGSTDFTSPLSSKSQIKFNFKIGSTYTFPSLTASMAYLVEDNGLNYFCSLSSSNAYSNPSQGSSVTNIGNDGKLFSPFGRKVLSGTHPAGVGLIPSPFHGRTIATSYVGATQYINNSNALISSRFLPTITGIDSAKFALSGIISHPFLLEKAVIRMPLSAASDWLADQTHITIASATNIVDAGGPCLTFGILNHRSDNLSRELILSCTVIPNGDNMSASYRPSGSLKVPFGYLSYSDNPSAVVSSNTGSSFIGDVIMRGVAGVSHGVYTIAYFYTSSFSDSLIMNIDPIGRSTEIKSSGRSYFRNDFLDLPLSGARSLVPDDSVTATIPKVFSLHKHSRSPYLLTPEDSLVFSISKHRPCITNRESSSVILTGSHSISIPSGTYFHVTLYGSMIKEKKEFEDSFPAPLTSFSINEEINTRILLDEFDVEPKYTFISSSLDRFMTGTLISKNDSTIVTGTRLTVGSAIQKHEMSEIPDTIDNTTRNLFRNSCAFQRFTQHRCENERYYDSLLPRPDQMFAVQGKTPVLNQASFYGVPTNVFVISGQTSGTLAGQGNNEWVRCFPFEPKFSAVTRTISPFRQTKAIRDFNDNLLNPPVFTDETGIFISLGETDGGTGARIAYTVGPPIQRPKDNLVAKILFGTGPGVSGSVRLGNTVGANYRINAYAHGVKYGLINFIPQYTKSIFRRNVYRGMKADMLEQRLFSKTRNDSLSENNSLTPISVNFSEIDPEETFSSNLSIESTSSLPFFDGQYKNRSSLLSGSA